ncbi:MAG: alcohol dehydrogenase catalytic domain-containing protein, partial [Terrimesophilobacter sp.]
MPNAKMRTGPIERAAVIYGAGDLRVEAREKEVLQPGHAVISLRSVGICGSDLGYFRGTSTYPVTSAFVLGHEAMGVVAAVDDSAPGRKASALTVGTRVALIPGSSCGHCELCLTGLDNLCRKVRYLGSASTDPPVDGALRTSMSLPIERLVPLPDQVSDASAALLEPLAVAEHAVRRADVAGRSVLITGGGAIGQLLALTARAAGASKVTVCELVQRRRQLALDHGADQAVEPKDIEQAIAKAPIFDVALDATGNQAAVDLGIRAVKPGTGRVVIVGNLPQGSGIPIGAIARSEIWVTATFRFPEGLSRALELVLAGLEIDWIVERVVDLDHLDA